MQYLLIILHGKFSHAKIYLKKNWPGVFWNDIIHKVLKISSMDFINRLKFYQKPFSIATSWCKSGTRTPGPGTSEPWDPGVGPPSKFKSGTPGSPSKFQSRTSALPSKFKSWTPGLSLMNSFFSEYLIVFYLFVFFK